MTSAISIRNISKAFGAANKTFVALEDISIDIHDGELLAIVGPSGSGKSTLLQIIAGLIKPTSGTVHFRGQPVREPPEGMIYLFQQYSKSLLPWRTVGENVVFGFGSVPKLSREEQTRKTHEYLEMVGLKGLADSRLWELSGGMQQRVAIARALSAHPSVLLLDEPFSAVDALTRMELQSLVLNIQAQHKLTVVLVTHDVDEAVFMSDRIAILSRPPARFEEVVTNGLPRPRDLLLTREQPQFIEMRHHLMERLLRRTTSDV